MRIVLFIDNHSMGDVDISNLYFGNPGIGGTQYEMFLLAKLMLENDKSNEFKLLLTNPQRGFTGDKVFVLEKFDDVFEYCDCHSIDILIMRENKKIDLIEKLTNTKVIFWIHNFISYDLVRMIGKSKNIKRVIFVSKQHYDYYLEYNLNKKATYIYNALAFPSEIPHVDKKENNVVFTGNIVPIKRLHLVTKIWPDVIKKVPDAKLLVIGTGASAHRDIQLGPFGIAKKDYESIILEPLIKSNTLNTVKFLGILGIKKNDVIRSAKVGVSPNKDETFCLCAAEYILNGVPVVGVKKGGINDVVIHKKTGLLHRSMKRIKKDIINLLLEKKKITITDEELNLMKTKFGFESFYNDWQKNILEVYNNKTVKCLHSSKPRIDKAKWAGSIFRFLRKVFHLPERFTRLGLYKILKRS